MGYTKVYMQAFKPFHDEENGKDRVKDEIFVIGEDKQNALEKQRVAFRFYNLTSGDEQRICEWLGNRPHA